jgi:hypothetical protein
VEVSEMGALVKFSKISRFLCFDGNAETMRTMKKFNIAELHAAAKQA